jgi:hypothetical protein
VFEIAELCPADQEHHRDRPVALFADAAEERPAAVGVGVDVDDRSGPSAGGFVLGGGLGRRHGLPPVPREVERARELG